jgi:hypothetical protein
MTTTQNIAGHAPRIGQKLTAAALAPMFPIGAKHVDGTVTAVSEYPTHTAVVVSVPGADMLGDTLSYVIR